MEKDTASTAATTGAPVESERPSTTVEEPTTVARESMHAPAHTTAQEPDLVNPSSSTTAQEQQSHIDQPISTTAAEPPSLLGQEHVVIEVETGHNDTDSSLGDDTGASVLSESLRSSIYNHRYENGRRYHAFRDGAYLNPDDEDEQDRLDLLHHLWRMMLDGRLYIASIAKDPRYILDIGTGTGMWAIDMADEHPSALVIGTDLSPIQPTWVPPNCTFYVDDAETEWLFNERFDFIHGRGLCGAISDWPKLLRQAYNNLKPGGWVELQEYEAVIRSDDDTINRSQWTTVWVNEINRGSEMFGKNLNVAAKYREWTEQAGFEEVREEIIKVPLGPWAKDPKLKEMGSIEQAQMIQSVEAFTLALYTRVLGYSVEQTQVVMEGVKKEFKDRKNHWYITYHFIVGRKPEI